jgi:membrane fusion protein, multidrug efflux system
MKASRIAAGVIVLAAGAWIASGSLGKDERRDALQTASLRTEAPAARFKVAVIPVQVTPHARRITLSGRTEADKRATAMTRASGIVVDLRVKRGSVVKTGEVIAVLSDEAREAQVAQARARLLQRRQELGARLKLIEQGNLPALQRHQLEAEMSGAEAGLAQAEAEREKGHVLAPISGVVNDVPVEVGQALQAGANIAEVIALDPMLAVIEIAERQLAGVKVGDRAESRLVTGEKATGTVRFVSRKASPQTRTYRVEVGIENRAGAIPDGVTCEVDLMLAAVPAARVPRSALTFSSEGKLGVRVVGEGGKVAFVPVTIVEDALDQLWLGGVAEGANVIVQGQDFVKEGQVVDTVPANGAA